MSAQPASTDFDAVLERLAAYEKHLTQANAHEQRGSLDAAADLAYLFNDPEQRWVAERNAERAATAKTPAGGRPVDPKSRSQFATWLKGRYSGIAPRTVYQLLDADHVASEFLAHAQITPTTEAALRPLKNLRRVVHGSGSRIAPIWELACEMAGGEPTQQQVREAIAEWNRRNLPHNSPRKESRRQQFDRKYGRAKLVIDDLAYHARVHPEFRDIALDELTKLQQVLTSTLDELTQ